MTVSDRLYLFLAEGTPQYERLVDLVGQPSCANPTVLSPADEYVKGINLEDSSSSFQERLTKYGNVPIRTFSMLS